MENRYCCPNCKTNRTRFNIIRQNATPVKKDPETGAVVEEFQGSPGPFHIMYSGPDIRVQCAACGVIESENAFASFGKHSGN